MIYYVKAIRDFTMNKSLQQKLAIARRVAYIFQLIPYVRMIGLCNSVACGTAKPKSDIDLFIIAKDKHIFTVRYGAVLLQTILGLKPYPDKKQSFNRISLSFFLSMNALNLDRICKNKREETMRVNWITNLVPLYDENNTYLDFIDKNSWVKKFKPKYYFDMSKRSKDIKFSFSMFVLQKIQEVILFFGLGYLIEGIVRAIQIKRLLKLKHSHTGKEKMVINDQMIKLHYIEKNDKDELY